MESVKRIIKNNKGILVVLAILFILISIVSPVFLSVQNLITLLQQVAINVIIALGMTLVIILGGIDLSVGSIVALSGTLCVGLVENLNLNIILAVLLSIVIGTLIGLINGKIITKFKLPAFIVTLATMNIARGAAYLYSGGRSLRSTNEIFSSIGNTRLFGVLPISILYMFVLVAIFSVLLSKTKFGTYVYAIGGNRQAASFSGIQNEKVETIVYVLSGFLAALAGVVLASRMYSGQPSVGQGYEMNAIAACVLGGVSMSGGQGNISGTFFGAIVIGIVSNGLNLVGVSSFWQLVIMGIIILLAVIVDAKRDTFLSRKKGKNNDK